jgi:hypothetical protein
VADLYGIWADIKKEINEAAAKIMRKKKDHREIVGSMKNVV